MAAANQLVCQLESIHYISLCGRTVHVLDDRRVAVAFLTGSIRDFERESIDSSDVGNIEAPYFER